jgi:hypothetical protein
MRREKTQISKIRNEKGVITINKFPGFSLRKFRESSGTTLRTYYSNKLKNLEEMDKFLDTYDNLNQTKGYYPPK